MVRPDVLDDELVMSSCLDQGVAAAAIRLLTASPLAVPASLPRIGKV
jgi:hypothetical protein